MKKTSKKPEKFESGEVAAVFNSYPDKLNPKLLRLRQLILETAEKTAGVGRLEETLKWGQPSYLTPETKSGSTVRIGVSNPETNEYAMYFHCQTNLVPSFKHKYRDNFTFEGNRAIIFKSGDKLPVKELKDCISMALTYHLNKKQK